MRRQRWVACAVRTAAVMLSLLVPQHFCPVFEKSLSFGAVSKRTGELLEAAMAQELITVPPLGNFLIQAEESAQRFRNFSGRDGVKYACECRSLPSGHREDRAAPRNHPSYRLRRATAASPADRFHPASNVCKRRIPHPRRLLRLFY